MNAPAVHVLSDIDEDSRSAWCAGCGERVDINRANRGRWQCGPANWARAKAWREANPERAAATKVAYQAADPEKYGTMRRAAGQRWADKHRQELRDKANAKRERQRALVIETYGCRCNCPGCHVVHAELLTLDHVTAAHHRRRKSTRDMYALVIKLGFPLDYQMLCGSCNLAKGDRDKCPLAGEDH